MTQFFLGVDIGATKSHALVADGSGKAVGFGKAGPGSHEVVGYQGLIHALKECTGAALQMAGLSIQDIQAAGFGIAGYDWPGELTLTQDAISSLGLQAPAEVVNDTIIGLVAGAEKGWGIGLVSGTGCNCWGWDENHKIGRVTGMGDMFGEYAGGGDIVRKAIVAVAYQEFRRGPATLLTQMILEMTGAADTMDLLEGLTLGRYQIDSGTAPLVIQAAQRGDEAAQGILRWAGRELGEMANCVIRQISLEDTELDIVLIGSIFNSGELLIDSLRQTIHKTAPGANLVKLQSPPVVGGVLLGMQTAGFHSPAVRATLIGSTLDLLSRPAQQPTKG
jgi:N-acetylglucosamine kinase-like BadF-type ATPase